MIEIDSAGPAAVICRPIGDLDITTATSVRHLIAELLCPELDLVIDLSKVTFIDGTGVSALVGAVRRVRGSSGHARVTGACRQVSRVLRLTGVDELLRHQTP